MCECVYYSGLICYRVRWTANKQRHVQKQWELIYVNARNKMISNIFTTGSSVFHLASLSTKLSTQLLLLFRRQTIHKMFYVPYFEGESVIRLTKYIKWSENEDDCRNVYSVGCAGSQNSVDYLIYEATNFFRFFKVFPHILELTSRN